MKIFISGIHGVGKGTISKKLIEKYPGSIHLSAGELIKRALSDRSVNKLVTSPEQNQNILMNELLKEDLENKTLFLDGHFCLINSSQNIIDIDKSTYLNLNLNAIIVIIDNISDVVQRIHNRDNKNYDLELFTKLQERELFRAEMLSKELNIPLLIFHSSNDSITLLNNFIDKFLG